MTRVIGLVVAVMLYVTPVFAGEYEEKQLMVALLQEKAQRLQMEFVLVSQQLKMAEEELKAMPKPEEPDVNE